MALGIGSGPAPDRLAVLSAALALFRQAASTAPLLIVIDDLHWLDRASGAVVGFVGRRLHGSRIGLLGAIRPGVGGFFERAGLPEFDVAPLVEADAMELLARQFVHLPTRVRRSVVDEAQGNPLALLEFAASAGLPRQRSTERHRGLRVEPRGADAVRGQDRAASRADATPAPARGARRLRQTSACWRRRAGREVSRSSGPPSATISSWSTTAAGEMRFRHPMIKSVVVERSTHDERRRAHQRLAELFADQPERRGHHLAEAARRAGRGDRRRGRGRRPAHAATR